LLAEEGTWREEQMEADTFVTLCGGMFVNGSGLEAKDFDKLFGYEVPKMFKAEGKINDAVVGNMLFWYHFGVKRIFLLYWH